MKNALIIFLLSFISFTSFAVTCEQSKSHGHGFSTHIESVKDNCDGSHTIVLRVEHNGCSGSKCKDLSNFAVEAAQGSYSNVSVSVISGSMSYGNLDLGPNLGSKIPFSGFKIDGISGIGNGKAGVFNITYTLNGGLQSQQVSAKPGPKVLIESFSDSDFSNVMTCQGKTCGNSCGTSPALDFNVFVDEDLKLVTNETEGPVAVCRDLWIKGNYQISTHSTGNFKVKNVPVSLVVGNKVKYISGNQLQINSNGYVKIGDCGGSKVWYKDQNNAFSPIRITKNNWYNSSPRIHLQANANQLGISPQINPVCESNVLDFAQAFVELRQNSANLSQLPNNAQLTNPNGAPISNTNLPNQVKINLQQGENVLNISGSDLNNVSVFTYNQKPNANRYLIINVDAPGNFNWNVWNQAGIGFNEAQYILYNFYNTANLAIKGSSTVEGTILAPSTHIEKKVNQANIEGQVIAKSLYHSGGEIHYALFRPEIQGCITVENPTVSAFEPDVTETCLEGNQFVFSNGSTGRQPLTYFWDFGDGNFSNQTSPVHTFSNPGTYTVMLAASGPSGNDTSYTKVFVHPMPNAAFSVNDTIQDSTNNNFQFSPVQLSNIQSLNWSFGDGTNSTLLFPSHSYQQVGGYNTTLTFTDKNGCISSSSLLVSVIADTASSGNDGGIESQSLEGKLSQLKFERKMSNHKPFSISTAQKFELNKGNELKNGKPNSARLEQFIPTSLKNMTGYVSSPSHLVAITNADEVVSVDYADGNTTKAVVLAAITSEEPYNHTKYTCDRFLKGKITYLEPIEIQGINCILFSLEKYNGIVEYGIEFSASYNVGDPSFDMQTSWLINEYAEKDSLYNFQIWANQPSYTLQLAEEILNNLQTKKGLTSTQPFHSPAVYVTQGYREEGKLLLTVKNTTPDPYLTTVWAEKENEQVPFDTIPGSAVSKENDTKTLEYNVGDKYEFDIYFYLNDRLEDKVYMADANWGLDYVSSFTSISNFSISNNLNQVDYSEKLPLYRDVALNVSTEDYITLFKDVTAGGLPTNLNQYKGLSFWASGKGKVRIRLFSESISHWRAQYYTFIDLEENGQLYQIPFTEFVSDSSNNSIGLTDIVTTAFTYVSESSSQEVFEISLNDAAFVKSFQAVSVKEEAKESNYALSVSPNPSNGIITISSDNSLSDYETLIVRDISGREVVRRSLSNYSGQKATFNLKNELAKGSYILTLQDGETLFTSPLIVK